MNCTVRVSNEACEIESLEVSQNIKKINWQLWRVLLFALSYGLFYQILVGFNKEIRVLIPLWFFFPNCNLCLPDGRDNTC